MCYVALMKTLLLSASLLLIAVPASAQMVVFGDGDAQLCYQSTKMGNPGSMSAIKTCTAALEDTLSSHDEAATHVNRGVLLMRKGDNAKALADYDVAIEMKPELAEAYINKGVALFYMSRDTEALAAYDKAVELKTEKMAEVLYNRALVHERLGDAKSAYYDLKAAIALKPEWDQARDNLARFTVTRKES